METDEIYLNPKPHMTGSNFSFQKMNSSGILLGSTANTGQSQTPMYNTFFTGATANQPAYGYQNPPPTFMYRERKGKVNWRNINNLDVDEVVARGDIKTLEAYLSNITFANLEKDDLEKVGDSNLLKLFRLSQYGLEYLLNCQNYLANQAHALDVQYKHSEERLKPIEEQIRRNHSEITNLKGEIKQKESLIKTYKKTLKKPFFKCHFCSKYFQSTEYLEAHFLRKHPVTTPPPAKPTVLKDEATSPLHAQVVQPVQAKEQNVKASNRYKKVDNDDDIDTREEPRRAAHANLSENAVQTNPSISTNDNTMNIQSSIFFERLINQFKEEEDLKLSRLNTNIQERMQELIRTNQELTSKVVNLEKKLENQSFVSPSKESNERYAKSTLTETLRKRSDDNDLKELQKRDTAKKGKGYQDLDAIGETLERETIVSEDVDSSVRDSRQTLKPTDLFRDIPVSKEKQTFIDSSNQRPRQVVTQELNRVEVPYEQQQNYRTPQKESNINEISKPLNKDPTIAKRESESIVKRESEVAAKREAAQQPSSQSLRSSGQRQVFHSGSLADVPEEKSSIDEQETIGSRKETSLKNLDQKTRDLQVMTSKKEAEVSPVLQSSEYRVRKAVYNSGELKADREHTGLKSSPLEDDEDSQIFRKSNEDFVIMEKDGEDGDYRREKLVGNLSSPDDVREKHKDLVTKAQKTIKNRYQKEFSKEEEEEVSAQLEKYMSSLCQKKFGVPTEKLKEQDNNRLENILADLKKMNSKDTDSIQKFQRGYAESQRRSASAMRPSPINQDRSSQDTYKSGDFRDSPKIANSQNRGMNNNAPMQSSELKNLLMNSEPKRKDLVFSQEQLSGRKQVLDSQNLEQHLRSVDDFRPSSFAQKGKQDIRESGNLIKKSIESGIVEQI